MTLPTNGNIVAGPNRAARRHPELPPTVLDRRGAAAYLAISVSLLAELTETENHPGSIPSLKIAAKRLYRRSDLDAWLAEKVSGGGAA